MEDEIIYCCGCCDEAKYKFCDEEYCADCLIEAIENDISDEFIIYRITK